MNTVAKESDYRYLIRRLDWEAANKGWPPFDGWKWLHDAASAIRDLLIMVDVRTNEQREWIALAEASRKDAARYRYLRDYLDPADIPPHPDSFIERGFIVDELIDKEIHK